MKGNDASWRGVADDDALGNVVGVAKNAHIDGLTDVAQATTFRLHILHSFDFYILSTEFLMSQSTGGTHVPEHTASAIKSDIKNLHALSTKILVDKDVAAVRDHYSPYFSTTGGDFNFHSREDIIKGLEGGDHKYDRIHSEIEDVHVPNESTAIVVGKRHVQGLINGERFEANYPLKAVYSRHGDKWQLVLWAVSRP